MAPGLVMIDDFERWLLLDGLPLIGAGFVGAAVQDWRRARRERRDRR